MNFKARFLALIGGVALAAACADSNTQARPDEEAAPEVAPKAEVAPAKVLTADQKAILDALRPMVSRDPSTMTRTQLPNGAVKLDPGDGMQNVAIRRADGTIACVGSVEEAEDFLTAAPVLEDR